MPFEVFLVGLQAFTGLNHAHQNHSRPRTILVDIDRAAEGVLEDYYTVRWNTQMEMQLTDFDIRSLSAVSTSMNCQKTIAERGVKNDNDNA